jgi:hypothetical protein
MIPIPAPGPAMTGGSAPAVTAGNALSSGDWQQAGRP